MTQFSGSPMAVAQGLYDISSTQLHGIGEMIFTNDGRRFAYAKAGGVTLVSGTLLQAVAEDTTNLQNLAVAAAAIGATSVTTTTTVTLTANQVSGGLLAITTSAGIGKIYKIASHAAATAAAVTFVLEDPIQVALTTGSRIDIAPNAYSGVIINPSTATSAPVGVAVCPITNAQFGWVQNYGAAPVLADGALAIGTNVVASNATAGAAEAATGVQASVGIVLANVATTEVGLVRINL